MHRASPLLPLCGPRFVPSLSISRVCVGVAGCQHFVCCSFIVWNLYDGRLMPPLPVAWLIGFKCQVAGLCCWLARPAPAQHNLCLLSAIRSFPSVMSQKHQQRPFCVAQCRLRRAYASPAAAQAVSLAARARVAAKPLGVWFCLQKARHLNSSCVPCLECLLLL